jgi:hypothetical protein
MQTIKISAQGIQYMIYGTEISIYVYIADTYTVKLVYNDTLGATKCAVITKLLLNQDI